MENELDGFSDVLQRDIALLDADPIPHSTSWHRCRAELIRLARENAELRDREAALWSSVGNAQLRAFIEKHGAPHPLVQRAERAESELAALRKRVADAPVVTLGAIVRGDVVMSVMDDPGKRVHLVEESV